MSFTVNTLKKTFWLFISHHIQHSNAARLRWGFAALLIVVDVAVASLIPYYSKHIVDSVSLNIMHSAWVAIILLGVFWVLEKTTAHLQEIIFFPVINLTVRNLTYYIVQHIHHISLDNYKKLSISEVINCIRRISFSARLFIKILLLTLLPTFFKLAMAVTVTLKMGLFGLTLLPAILFALIFLHQGTKWYVKTREAAWHITDQVITRINDSLLNTKIVRPVEQFEMDQLGNLLNREANLWHKTNTRLHTIYILIGIVLGLTMTSILACAMLAIQDNRLTVGDFILLKGQLIAAFLPFRTFSLEFRQLAEALIDIKKIVHIFAIPKQERLSENSAETTISKSIPNGIFLKNVSFTHEDKLTIFKHISLHIAPRQKVAIIGSSGCGKSTLINLMAGLYQPSSGNIYLNQTDINRISGLLWHKKLHCIPQDFRLFNMSLRDNLTYGNEFISDTELTRVLQFFDLFNTIEKMPQGLDTAVGEMGVKLSGGEKQKIALARALLLKPEFLLLDETTSALNFEGEKLILEVLFSSIPTVILASHRTSTLPYMDRVFKIEKGGNLIELDITAYKTKETAIYEPLV